MNNWIWITLLTLLPITELRGGLPFALLEGNIAWYLAYPYCVILNALVCPIAYFLLNSVHIVLYKWKFYARLFDKFIERARHKIAAKVHRWGFWGLVIFVGIPLPITGAWTGTVGAWVLGLDRRRTMLAILAGVAISGLIISAIVLLGFEAFGFVTKHV